MGYGAAAAPPPPGSAGKHKGKARRSKYVGVSWDMRRCKWVAGIKHERRKRHLGRFDPPKTHLGVSWVDIPALTHGEFSWRLGPIKPPSSGSVKLNFPC
jgi:hypothetical protein